MEWAQGEHLQIDMLRHVLARKGHQQMDEYHLIQRRSAPQQASARWIAENRLGMHEERFDKHKHVGAITKKQARYLRYMVVEDARLRAGLGACKTGTRPGRVCFVADASALPRCGPGGSIVRNRVYVAARQVRAHACPQARLPAYSCAPMLAPKPACPRASPCVSVLAAAVATRVAPPLVRCTCPARRARAATTGTRRAGYSSTASSGASCCRCAAAAALLPRPSMSHRLCPPRVGEARPQGAAGKAADQSLDEPHHAGRDSTGRTGKPPRARGSCQRAHTIAPTPLAPRRCRRRVRWRPSG